MDRWRVGNHSEQRSDGNVKRLILVVLAVLLVVPAAVHARTATITWVAPTERTDGSALPSSQIAGYVFSCRVNGEHVDKLDITNGTETQAVTTYADLFGTDYGTYQCAMRTVDTTGLESPLSTEVEVLHFAGPGAPSELKWQVEAPSVFSRISGMVGRLFR
jgi:uncharacterized protein YpuA (DUF1002 family)